MKKQMIAHAAALLALGALSGCGGGGGGGGGGGFALPLIPASTPASAPAPAPVTAPAPAPAPAPVSSPSDPVAGSEVAPSLSAPQAGSTAAVGNNSEGIYEQMFGYTYVGATGSISSKLIIGAIFGSITVTSLNWVFDSTTQFYSSFAPSTVTGSGTFSPKASMDGSYATGSGSSTAFGPLTYSTANALAVSQASLVGTWTSSDSSIGLSVTVDATGAFTGTTSGTQIGTCTISGSIVQAQPGTAKNMYGITMNAVNAATTTSDACKLDTTAAYAGPSAIVFVPAGIFVGNGYFRSLSLLGLTSNGAALSATMQKQS